MPILKRIKGMGKRNSFSPDFSRRKKRKKRKSKKLRRSKSLPAPKSSVDDRDDVEDAVLSKLSSPSKLRSFRDPHICSLRGPILFTAPHSITVVRKFSKISEEEDDRNAQYKRKKKTITENEREILEIHHMERHTAALALKLAVATSEMLEIAPSFMIWNLFAGFKETNFDPNYTLSEWFSDSPWHRALHQFKAINMSVNDESAKNHSMSTTNSINITNPTPMLHIDLHGRQNRVGDINLDIGSKAMEQCWIENPKCCQFMNDLNQFWIREMNPILEAQGQRFVVKKDSTKTPLGIRVELNPKYEGFRGHQCDGHTMVHQSVLVGNIVAIQLELPTVLRTELMENESFFNQFARCIADLYVQIVVKWKDLFAEEYSKCHITEKNGGCRTACTIQDDADESDLEDRDVNHMIKNEQLDIDETRNLLRRITNISKSILTRCRGRDWCRLQKKLYRNR